MSQPSDGRTALAWVVALTIAAAVFAAPASAQEDRRVSGALVDSAGAAVANAMVVALTRSDSVLVTYALSDGNGRFLLRDLTAGEYVLQVTSLGYLTVRQDLDVATQDVDAGSIVMRLTALEIDPLVVTAEQVPFVNRRDTLDYNAAAFQIRPNATVEQLLARLPGVTVDDDGTITAQGEEVTQVLVDGKEFFGSDPTIATRNLPADAVERVQIYDRRSDMAELTGIEDGEEERTVNLELREEARRGVFGNVSGALGGEQGGAAPIGPEVGDQLRYQQSFSVNRFTPGYQLALVGGVNNINEAGFAWGDAGRVFGGRGGIDVGGGRRDGLTETRSLGLNVGYNPDTERWIRTSYFYTGLENVLDQLLQRDQLFGSEVSTVLAQTTGQTTDNRTHSLNLNAQYQFSEGHDVRLRGSFSSGSSGLVQSQTQVTELPAGDLVNTATTGYVVNGDNLSGNGRLTWRKRLDEAGRSIVFQARGDISRRDQVTDLDSRIGTPAPGDLLTYEEVLQQQDQETDRFTESQRLSLTQPVGGNRVIEVFAERSSISEDQLQSVYDVSGGGSVFDDQLSSALDQTYGYLRGGLRLSRNTEKSFLTLGAQVQRSSLDGRVLDRDETIERDFDYVLPDANFRYEIRDGWNFSARYQTSTREPDTEDLQPYTDNTDPLVGYTGNPELRPEYRHTFRVDQRYFDQFTFRNVFAYGRFTYVDNAIAQARAVDERGVQQVSPVNTANSWSTNGGLTVSSPIRSLGIEATLGYDVLFSRSSAPLNGETNETQILRNTVRASLENRRKTAFSLEGGVRLNFNDVTYTISDRQNQSYLNPTLFADGEWYPGSLWTLTASVDYQIFDEAVFGPGEDVALVEASLRRAFLDDRAELQLVAFDLLDQNQGVQFTNSPNFVQESRTATLGRHMLLRFVYRLGRGGGGDGGRGRGFGERRR